MDRCTFLQQNAYYDPNNPPINGQRLKRSTSFSGTQPRSFQQVYGGMNENEALQMAMERNQDALSRVHGIYREDVYGEVEWPLNGHPQALHNMTYGVPGVETYHHHLHHGNGTLPRHR